MTLLWSPVPMVPEPVGRGVGPLVYVTLCTTPPELHVQVTVPPCWTTTSRGEKKLFATVTPAVVGGAAASAVKVTGGRLATVAVTVCTGSDGPSVCTVVAMPFAAVVLCAAV